MSLRFLILGALAALGLAGAGPVAAQPMPPAEAGLEIATFAGGCFWCVESDFDHVPGVVRTVSGYTGGSLANPSYESHEGHREAVRIYFDPKKVSYEKLLDVFWHSVDPTDAGGQFCDRGHSYTTAIYASSEEQKRPAEASKKALEASHVLKQPIVTPIEVAGPFWRAEDYHQDYYTKNPLRYRFYRFSCGRDARLEALWGEDAHRGIEKH